MKAFFNELSVGFPSLRLTENFDKVKTFFELIEHISTTYGINLIIIIGRFNGLKICDTLIADCFNHKNFNFDQRNLLQQLANYFNNDPGMDKSLVFTHSSTNLKSILLGNAHSFSKPAISFTFHEDFARDIITGFIDDRQANVYNLHNKNQNVIPLHFVSVHDCKPFDPTVTPLWNTDAITAYHNSIEAELNSIKTNPERKIATLCKCADTIAQLNGWELDEKITKLNKNSGAFRRIYHSTKFTRGEGYLSVDFEKPEVFFELHDKRGRHLGEYYWNGDPHKESDPKKRHNIDVR